MPISKTRYHSDPEYREKILSYHREWNKRNNYWLKENRSPRNKELEATGDRQRFLKAQKLCRKIFGIKCVLCSRPGRFLHEINGKSHSCRHPRIYLKRPEDFKRVCGKCHNMVHGLLRFNITWEETVALIRGKGHG